MEIIGGWEICSGCDGDGYLYFYSVAFNQIYAEQCSSCMGNGIAGTHNETITVPIVCGDCGGWGHVINTAINAIECEACGGTGFSVPTVPGGGGGGNPPPPPEDALNGTYTVTSSGGVSVVLDFNTSEWPDNWIAVQLGESIQIQSLVWNPSGWLHNHDIYYEDDSTGHSGAMTAQTLWDSVYYPQPSAGSTTSSIAPASAGMYSFYTIAGVHPQSIAGQYGIYFCELHIIVEHKIHTAGLAPPKMA